MGFGLLLGVALWTLQPQAGFAVEGKPATELREEKPAEPSAKAIPFQGKVVAVDLGTRTFTLGGKTRDKDRAFRVSETTPILQNNQAVEFSAIVLGELVRGQAFKRSDGWEAKKVMIGPKLDTSAAR
jgi:hypothetical protein